jgi:hypothetical protein
MQKTEKEHDLALQEQKKTTEDLKADLQDQEDLLRSSSNIKLENQRLSLDVSRLRESESFLSGRVEELEQESCNLKSNLSSVDKKIWDRERRWQEKLDSLEDELATSLTTTEDSKMQHSLKIEVEGLKTQSHDLKKALDEKVLDADKSETAFRSEVSLPLSSGSAPNLSSANKHKMGLVRYRSLRDHNGRYYLVVKVV